MISQTVSAPLRRWGSCESGFFSAATEDWIAENGIMSNKSTGSSLLTVSDLEVSFIITVNIGCIVFLSRRISELLRHYYPGKEQAPCLATAWRISPLVSMTFPTLELILETRVMLDPETDTRRTSGRLWSTSRGTVGSTKSLSFQLSSDPPLKMFAQEKSRA